MIRFVLGIIAIFAGADAIDSGAPIFEAIYIIIAGLLLLGWLAYDENIKR